MKTLDKFEILTRDGQPSFQIMGNVASADFALIDTADLPLSDEDLHAMRDLRGMCWLGVVGLVEGVPRTALDEDLNNATVDALARAFLACIAAKLRAEAVRTDDPVVKYLADLYALDDPRPS